MRPALVAAPVPVIAPMMVLGLVLSGCGATPPPRPALTEPTTDRALAAAVVEHVGGTPSRAQGIFDAGDRRRGADVTFSSADAPDDGTDLDVSVVVEPTTATGVSCGDHDDCETTRVGDREVLLGWAEETPGEDTGDWFVRTRQGSTMVTVRALGPRVRDDPRHGDLAELTEHLRDIAADPRVGFRTTPAYVRAGAAIAPGVWHRYGSGG